MESSWTNELYELALLERPRPDPDDLAGWLLGRLERIHTCRAPFTLELKSRPTVWALGRYYRSRALIRIYTHCKSEGPRPRRTIAAIFLHELAHHLEYTEPDTFGGEACERVPGVQHSPLFRQILRELVDGWRVAVEPREMAR